MTMYACVAGSYHRAGFKNPLYLLGMVKFFLGKHEGQTWGQCRRGQNRISQEAYTERARYHETHLQPRLQWHVSCGQQITGRGKSGGCCDSGHSRRRARAEEAYRTIAQTEKSALK